MKKPLKSQSGGAKAPSLLSNITGADLQQLAESVSTLIHARTIDAPLVDLKGSALGTSLRANAINQPPKCYKHSLENIHSGLCELLGSQRSFQQYLNPGPEVATGKTMEGTPCGFDELLSSIETLLNTNLLTFNDIRNKF